MNHKIVLKQSKVLTAKSQITNEYSRRKSKICRGCRSITRYLTTQGKGNTNSGMIWMVYLDLTVLSSRGQIVVSMRSLRPSVRKHLPTHLIFSKRTLRRRVVPLRFVMYSLCRQDEQLCTPQKHCTGSICALPRSQKSLTHLHPLIQFPVDLCIYRSIQLRSQRCDLCIRSHQRIPIMPALLGQLGHSRPMLVQFPHVRSTFVRHALGVVSGVFKVRTEF